MTKKLFLPLWALGSTLLFLYSFTQVDLSLTLSQASIFQTVQKVFQYVGWFNRPLSVFLYILLFVVLFALYFWTMFLIQKKRLSKRLVWSGVLIVTGITFISYNAFSYDLFNYIFDAKIVTHYNQNPYLQKALDYLGDPMLSFMRWTHRVYPYGPFWLALTVPISFVGMQIFSVTLLLFKLFIASFFILTVWSIGKIGEKLKLDNALLPIAAFAFNPFVITESLVSSHNDIVMMGIGVFGIYLLLQKKRVFGGVVLLLSVGVKFVTLAQFILFFILSVLNKTKYFIPLSLLSMLGAVILASMRTNFQPWYMLFAFPFAVLMIDKKYIRFPLYIFSISNVLYYIPFLYTGNWDPPIPSILNGIVIASSLLSVLIFLFFFRRKKHSI